MNSMLIDSNAKASNIEPANKYLTESQELIDILTRGSAFGRAIRRKLDIFPTWAICELNRRAIVRDYRKDFGLITPIAAELEQKDDDANIAYIKTYQESGETFSFTEAIQLSKKYGWTFWDEEKAA